jgi:Spy/CpxP family protein refolding chaperone
MDNRTIFSAAMVLLLCLPGILTAQKLNQAPRRASWPGYGCVSAGDLNLTGDQSVAMEQLDRIYGEQMSSLRGDLMRKRLELESVFRNPRADEQKIRTIAQEVSELQCRCLATTVDHQLKVRALLKPEQLLKWCTPVESCLKRSWSKEP